MTTVVDYINMTNGMEDALFPGSKERRQALKTQDYTANYGSPIPLSQGLRRLSGIPIWAGPLKDSTILGSYFSPDGPYVQINSNTRIGTPAISQITRSVTRSFAVSLGYNLAPLSDIDAPKVRRVWVDGTLVYANGTTVQPLWFDPYNNTYGPSWNKVPVYSGGVYGQPTGAPPVPLELGGGLSLNQVQANINFNFYAGTETQTPDAIIAADKGDMTPAYRGMMYLVIKDWVVGTSTEMMKYHVFGDGSSAYGSSKDYKLVNALPKIDVELVDGTTASSSPQDFDILPGAPSFPYSTETVVPNWNTRELIVAMPDGIQTYDMDAKAETSIAQYVYEFPTDVFGVNTRWTGWDASTNVIYGPMVATGTPNYVLASVDKASGVVTRVPYDNYFDLGVYDEDHNDPRVSRKPIVFVPGILEGDIGKYIFAGEIGTYICGGMQLDNSPIVLTVSNDGSTWPSSLPPEALWDTALPFNPSVIVAIPLLDVALENSVPAFQDGAFVMSYGNKIAIVYVKFVREILAGSPAAFVYGHIIGVQDIYTGPTGTLSGAFLTEDRNILIINYPSLTGLNQRIARINLRFDLSADYSVAPGWQGYFPHASEVIFDVDHPEIVPFQFTDYLKYNNAQYGHVLLAEKFLINTEDGSLVTDTSAVGVSTDSRTVWDGSTSTLFGHGNTASHGNQMRYCQLGTSLSGTIGSLASYLKWFGMRAGYPAAKIQVDSLIDDQVVGSIVVTTMDMAQLFNDLGTLYGFIWFVSNGTLKFIKNNKAPIKASAILTIKAQPVDGQTIVIGTSTYTFKLIPAAPYDVKIDDTLKETTLNNLMKAINKAGQDGYEYFSITSANAEVVASCPTDTTLKAIAREGGLNGNTVVVSSSNTSKLEWSSSTLLGGDVPPPASINLTVDNMMAVQNSPVGEGAALITTFQSPVSQNRAAAINYYNLDADYTLSTQQFVPDDGTDASGFYNTVQYDIPFVMASAEAYNRITKVAVTTTGTDVLQEFQLPQQFLRIEPSDIASVTIDTYNYTVRLDEVTINGDFTISASGVNYSFRDDIPIATYVPQARPEQSINGPGDGIPAVIDGPLLDPSLGVPGTFIVYSGVKTYGQAGWRSAQMQYNATELYTAVADLPYGMTSTVLPPTSTPFLTDVDTILRVASKTIAASDLANATDDQFYNNQNLLIVGKPGRWEYIAFKSVTAVNPKVFEFTGLARGRRGTNVNTDNHELSDEVYLVRSVAAGFSQSLFLQAQVEEAVGTSAVYTVIGLPATRTPVGLTVTFTGESLKPFSPCRLKAELVTGNDLDLTWNRRDRLSSEFITDDPLMSETSEKYDLEILNAGVVVRTLTDLTSPSYTYTSANQTTDGFSPPLASLEMRVYQKGELGRGYPEQETINVE